MRFRQRTGSMGGSAERLDERCAYPGESRELLALPPGPGSLMVVDTGTSGSFGRSSLMPGMLATQPGIVIFLESVRRVWAGPSPARGVLCVLRVARPLIPHLLDVAEGIA